MTQILSRWSYLRASTKSKLEALYAWRSYAWWASSNVRKRYQAVHWGAHTFQYLGHFFSRIVQFVKKRDFSFLVGVHRLAYWHNGTGQETSIEVPALHPLFSVTHIPFQNYSGSVSPENKTPVCSGVGGGGKGGEEALLQFSCLSNSWVLAPPPSQPLRPTPSSLHCGPAGWGIYHLANQPPLLHMPQSSPLLSPPPFCVFVGLAFIPLLSFEWNIWKGES